MLTWYADYQNRRLAKFLYHLSGHLSRVKWKTQTYRVEYMGDTANWESMVVTKSDRVWLPCPLSIKLMEVATELDRAHWNHWALVHENCNAPKCSTCGGDVCQSDEITQ